MVLLLSITLVTVLTNCSSLNESMAQDTDKNLNSDANSQNDLLSKDFSKADKALEKAIQMQDNKSIRLSLQNENLLIKKKAAVALGESKDKRSVPDLIKTLSDNQIIMNGGSEVISMQTDLNKAIVSALSRITRLNFDVSNSPSSDDISKILEQSQKWWDDYKKKN